MKKEKKAQNKAVALSYNKEEIAPRVIAKGENIVAEKIIEKAIEEDITIYQDENLVESLMGLELNEMIPEELYDAVAEIIFYIYNLDTERGKMYGK